MREIVILGSTGSIGLNTLSVVRHLGPEQIKVKGLAAKSNIDLLHEQIKEFNPEAVAVFDPEAAKKLRQKNSRIEILTGMEGLCSLAAMTGNPLVISSMTGTLGLLPTINAIQASNPVALANKEALVSGGALVTKLAKQHNVTLFPLDSEHSAIFQCLQGIGKNHIKKLILTASGGPFLRMAQDQLYHITPEQALKHPNWAMGVKVTIDCSTLMNKGLEVIEAHWLFDIPLEQIEVVIHPQSIVHSFVETIDSSLLAQMAVPDMRLPIQYALTYPERLPSEVKSIDFRKSLCWEFLPPDISRFKCLSLAYQALKTGGSAPCFLNAANEVLVDRFYQKEIPWLKIGDGLEQLLSAHSIIQLKTVEDILGIDLEARRLAATLNH